MPDRAHHHRLSDHVRAWTPERVARLLRRRPDLARPLPADLASLAERAQDRRSMVRAVETATLAENQLLQLVVCAPPDVPEDELGAMLPEGVSPADVEPMLASLEEAALIWRHGGRVHCSGTLRQVLPTPLGPPLGVLLRDQSADYVRHAIRRVRQGAADVGDPLPPPAVRTLNRAPRKHDLVDELEALVSAPGVVDAVLGRASAPARELALALAEGPPVAESHQHLYFSSAYRAPHLQNDPTHWLFEHALLLPLNGGALVAQPREVGVALRGGRPVPRLALAEPPLVTGTADPAAADERAGARASGTLDRLADILDRWEAEPVPQLKSGGLGVTVVRRLAAALDVEADEAAWLVELLHLAGVVRSGVVTRRQGRKDVYEYLVAPGPEAARWLDQPAPARWRELARAWLRAARWPSATGRKDPDGRAVAVLAHQDASVAPDRRAEVLAAVAEASRAADGTGATTAEALTARLVWQRPQPWLRLDEGSPGTVIGWLVEEAERLGVMADGRLSSFGAALVDGAGEAEVERLVAAALPAPSSAFTVQADMTVVAVGRLEREVLNELRLLADVESTGAATTFRLSEAGLRRGLDAGRSAAGIVAFLRGHGDKDLPGAVEFLVADVARRHGHLSVGTAAAFVTSADPAILADACSHRRTRKLGLRLLAPTVAVSAQPAAKVLAGLRDAGFLPTPDGEAGDGPGADGTGPGGATIELLAPRPEVRALSGSLLPEPFRRSERLGPPAPPTPAEARRLAADVVAGPPVQAQLDVVVP